MYNGYDYDKKNKTIFSLFRLQFYKFVVFKELKRYMPKKNPEKNPRSANKLIIRVLLKYKSENDKSKLPFRIYVIAQGTVLREY